MAVNRAFVEDYYDLARDVSLAGHQSFTQRLRDWLALIDGEPGSVVVIDQLAPAFDFTSWYTSAMGGGGFKGAEIFQWSANRRERLGQVLALFRHFAATPDEVLQFALRFYHTGAKLDDSIRKVNQELFDPMARDLIKELERSSATASAAGTAPASDRIVRLDDNRASVNDLQAQLNSIELAVEQSNELAQDEEGRDQALSELRAGRELMKSARVRVAAIAETIVPSLRWIGEKAAGTLIGVAVGAVLAIIATLFGIHIPKL